MSVKTILVAHRSPEVRDRFAAALADAHHGFVGAATARAARQAIADPGRPIHLTILDLGLAEYERGAELVRELAGTGDRSKPVLVFAGSVTNAEDVHALNAACVAGYVNEHASTAQILPALAPHLFPDSFNRRSEPRVPIEVPVSLRAGDVVAGAMTVNVSKGGVAIRTMNPLPVSSLVGLNFRLPGSSEEIETTGRVAWTDRKLLVGLQFENLPRTAEELLEKLLK